MASDVPDRVLAADADAYAAALELFDERGAGHVMQVGGTLLEHLRRVHGRLTRYGAGRAARLAGLCHAAYGSDGTDGTDRRLLADDEAPLLTAVIGAEAEWLVRLYADGDHALVCAGIGADPVVHADPVHRRPPDPAGPGCSPARRADRRARAGSGGGRPRPPPPTR